MPRSLQLLDGQAQTWRWRPPTLRSLVASGTATLETMLTWQTHGGGTIDWAQLTAFLAASTWASSRCRTFSQPNLLAVRVGDSCRSFSRKRVTRGACWGRPLKSLLDDAGYRRGAAARVRSRIHEQLRCALRQPNVRRRRFWRRLVMLMSGGRRAAGGPPIVVLISGRGRGRARTRWQVPFTWRPLSFSIRRDRFGGLADSKQLTAEQRRATRAADSCERALAWADCMPPITKRSISLNILQAYVSGDAPGARSRLRVGVLTHVQGGR